MLGLQLCFKYLMIIMAMKVTKSYSSWVNKIISMTIHIDQELYLIENVACNVDNRLE